MKRRHGWRPAARWFGVVAAACTALGVAIPAPATPAMLEHVANVRYRGGSDLEFVTKAVAGPDGAPERRDYAFAGRTSDEVAVIDVTDPADPQWVANVPCRLYQNDVQILGDVIVMAADRPGTCTTPEGAEGSVHGFATADISDPRAPRFLGSADIPAGAHNLTVHPTEPLVYVSPAGGYPSPTIPIWDVSDPAKPVKTQDWQYAGFRNSPHDITFNADGTRAYAAAISHTAVIDTTDPRKPVLVSVILHPEIYLSHQADPTPDGRYLLVSDEAGGGTWAPCPGGGVHVYDLADERDPEKVGAYWIDDVGFRGLQCTSHVFRVNPDGRTMAIAWYQAGVHVVDIADLVGYTIGGIGDGARTIASARMPATNAWAAKMWPERHPGYVFANDLARGFDVFRLP